MNEERKLMGYDPMTGEPIYEPTQETAPVAEAVPAQEATPVQQPQMQNGYMSMQPETPLYAQAPAMNATAAPKKPKKGLIIGIICAAVAAGVLILAIVAVIIILAVNGAFLSDKEKVALAIKNTTEELPSYLEWTRTMETITAEDHTITYGVDASVVEATLAVGQSESQKTLVAEVNGLNIDNIDAAVVLDDEEIKLHTSLVEDYIFSYNFVDKKEGYITEVLSQEDIEMIDSLFATTEISEEDLQPMQEDMLALAENIEFEKVEKEKFVVNGKEVNCKGYKMILDDAFMDDTMSIVEEYLDLYYGDMDDATMEELRYELDYIFDELADSEITFYIYKNQLAAMIIDVAGDEMEIQFQGGAYRTQNMVVYIDDDEILTLTGKTEDSVETMELEVDGDTLLELEYDMTTGDLAGTLYYESDIYYDHNIYDYNDMEAGAGEVKSISFDANIQTGEESVDIEIYDIEIEDFSFDVTISAVKGVEEVEMSGDVFDIGRATLVEWTILLEDLEAILEEAEDMM